MSHSEKCGSARGKRYELMRQFGAPGYIVVPGKEFAYCAASEKLYFLSAPYAALKSIRRQSSVWCSIPRVSVHFPSSIFRLLILLAHCL
jgi:hypothetical protein